MQHLSESLALAQLDIEARQAEADEARRELERARVEQQAFDRHRDEALRVHVVDSSRRLQSAADQDWLARQHVLVAAADEQEAKA
ncbi:hypothetical protein [Ideonella sp. YS5]|uniref:hypothetical protein n=1 Tax=Ideonella sp. YS5 TaxID=3453714 RepID=UPI003EEC0E9B